MTAEDMARLALAILWGGGLCGGVGLAFFLWMMAVAHSDNEWAQDGAALLAFIVTAMLFGGVFWTLSVADLFHVWSWLYRGRA